MTRSLALAVGFLTRLPVPAVDPDPIAVGRSLAWYPLVGALIGALILVAIPEAFRALADWRLFFYGAVLLLLILFRPQGLWSRVPAVDRAIAAIRRRRSAGVGSAP